MEDYKAQDNALTNNAVNLLERNSTEIERLKYERILDTNLVRTLDHIIQQNKNAIHLIQKNPRFYWVNIQNEIDECFSKDKNATGTVIYLDWKEVERGEEQRILIKGKIAKAS
jgi:hypothetical protein